MLRESNKPPSWNRIPTRARRSNRSCSSRWLISSPNKYTRPESGVSRPRATLSRVVLPLPAAPNNTRVSPACISKDTLSSPGVSPKCRLTSSKRMIFVPAVVGARAISEIEENAPDQRGGDEDPDVGDNHGRGGGLAHALRTAGGAQAVEASHHGDDDGEHKRFEQPLTNIVQHEALPRQSPV